MRRKGKIFHKALSLCSILLPLSKFNRKSKIYKLWREVAISAKLKIERPTKGLSKGKTKKTMRSSYSVYGKAIHPSNKPF